jgi:hypothetical protein
MSGYGKGGTTGATHELDLDPSLLRAFWSRRLCKVGQKVTLTAQFQGVPDGLEVAVELHPLSKDGKAKPKEPPKPVTVAAGKVRLEWTAGIDGTDGETPTLMVLTFSVSVAGLPVFGVSVNFLVVAEFGALIEQLDRCFCPGAEALQLTYQIVDLSKYVLSGIFRVYGNQYESAVYPDKKAIVYQRLLTPAELTDGMHVLGWEGFTNAAAGPLARPKDKSARFVSPLYSPYVVEIELLDRAITDPAKWPSDEALGSLPSPAKFDGLGLKSGGAGFAAVVPPEQPKHCGFEIVYAGLALALGTHVPSVADIPKGDGLYQYLLNQLGYFCGRVDGSIGPISKKGIHHFKRTHWEVVQDSKDPKVYRQDRTKPLGDPDLIKIKPDLDAKTKKAIQHEVAPRTWMEIVDAAGKPVPAKVNVLPEQGEQGRLYVDGTVLYQMPGEFYNDAAKKADVTKQDREEAWIPRPWIPVEARPLLRRKNGTAATAAASASGAGPARVLFCVVDPAENHAGLNFPTVPFTGLSIKDHTVVAGETTMLKVAKKHGFSSGNWIYNDPLNAAFKTANPNKNALTVGSTLKIPPFPNHVKYFKHKQTQPEDFVKRVVGDLAGTAKGDWKADNAPDQNKDASARVYGVRTKDESQRGVEAFRLLDKLRPLAPWKAEEVDDDAAGIGKAVAVALAPTGPKRGAAGIYFIASIQSGDNYRIEAWIDLQKGPDGKDLPNASALKTRYAAAPPRGATGPTTVWRRIDLAEYLYIKDRTLEPTKSQVDWSRFQDIFLRGYVDLVLPPNPAGRALTEDEYKTIVSRAYPKLKAKDVILDREELYPQTNLPLPTQNAGESAKDYLARVDDAVKDFHEKFAKVAGVYIRQRNRTGGIIVDFRRNHKPIPVNDSAGNALALDWDARFLSTGQSKGVLLMDQRDGDKAHYVFAHELGHSLLLYHWKNTGENNNQDHDNDDDYCLMMYPGDEEAGKIDPEYCGKCVLKLRGWNEKALPANAPPPPPAAAPAAAKTDLRLTLKDAEGNVLSDAPCVLEFPDGTKVDGRTDQDGLLVAAGVPTGKVKVRFVDEEQQA